MTEFAEVIYEDGSKSVVSVDDSNREDLKAGLAEQHRRAMNGEPGGPAGHPASRVKRVLMYDDHPADATDNKVDAKVVASLVDGMKDKSGKFDAFQLIGALRDETSPVYPVDQGAHESIYKAEATEELKLDFLPKDATL